MMDRIHWPARTNARSFSVTLVQSALDNDASDRAALALRFCGGTTYPAKAVVMRTARRHLHGFTFTGSVERGVVCTDVSEPFLMVPIRLLNSNGIVPGLPAL